MSTNSRFPLSTGANPFFKKENTFRKLTGDFQNPAYASTLALVINASKTIVQLSLTGVINISVNVGTGLADNTPPYVGDRIEFILNSDSTSRVVTWGTGFTPVAATLSVTTGKIATAQFVFNGTTWVGEGSAVTA